MADSKRPESGDTAFSHWMQEHPAPKAAATPTPERTVDRVVNKVANYTTGGASGLLQGAIKHF